MRHQCTDLPPSKHKKNNLSSQDRPVTSGMQVINNKCHHLRRSLIQNKSIQVEIDVPSVGIPDMWKVSSVLPRSFSINPVTNMDISQACILENKCLSSQEHPKLISYKLDKCMYMKTLYAASQKI